MRYFLFSLLIVATATSVSARSVEEHVLVHYKIVCDELQERGFQGPFAREVAKFALIRQIIEDGQTRDHSVSIVGMSPGGTNAEVLDELGLAMGKSNHHGLSLQRLTSSAGETFYCIKGPRANVCSAIAITMLWDKYVNGAQKGWFTPSEVLAWNKSKNISQRIATNSATKEEVEAYDGELAAPRRKIIEKANRIYSPTAASAITKIVRDMEPLFEFVKF
jgi:hypothetical protein